MNTPEWARALLGCLGAIGAGTVQPINAYIVGSVISNYFRSDKSVLKSKSREYAFIFLGIGALHFLSNVIQHYNFSVMGEKLTKRVRENLFGKLMTFEIGWFDEDENTSAGICARLATEANMVRSLVGDRMSLLVQAFFWVFVAYGLGFVLTWRLTLVMIAVQPVVIGSFFARTVLMKSMAAKVQKAQKEGSQLASEAVINHRTITAAEAGSMTSDISKGSNSIKSVFMIHDRRTEIDPDNPGGVELKRGLKGQVELRNVFFAYPARPDQMIFNGLSLKVQAGKTVALVGQSGSGKSTIIGLIERFYDPMKGSMHIDDQDIKEPQPEKVEIHIALVSQEPTLFAGTIRENIAYGKEDARESELRKAAVLADAHEFISGMKDGYDTYCGEEEFSYQEVKNKG
ncbi:hypothetical protein NL676_024255 [Syzygium grande]|nr:hypothetical protein NL676_024255 [Syzygium grande]